AKAVEAFKNAVTVDPKNAIARFALGEALFAQGDYHYAAYSIKKGLELNPHWVDVDAPKDKFYGSMAPFDAAMKQLEAYAQANPYDAASQFLLGYQNYFTGKYDESAAAFGREIDLVGKDASADLFTAKIPDRKANPPKPAESAPKSAETKPEETPATPVPK